MNFSDTGIVGVFRNRLICIGSVIPAVLVVTPLFSYLLSESVTVTKKLFRTSASTLDLAENRGMVTRGGNL